MAFQSPLVVSDNPAICKRFMQMANTLLPDIKFQVAISPFSNPEIFLEHVRIVDLKKEDDIDELLSQFDIVFSIHCKQLFPEDLVKGAKCINVHPGYNPINRGWYPQVFAIIHDLEIGATIHEITNELDNGPIIARDIVEKYLWDTSLSLYNRIVEKEFELLENYLIKIMEDEYELFISNKKSNLFLKQDFEELKEIDLTQRTTFKKAINRLRALTHGDYKNAYFTNEKGEKIFISLTLNVEKEDE